MLKAQDTLQPKTATVYFLRSSGFNGLFAFNGTGAFNVFVDDSLVCYLNNNCYSTHQVVPGMHRMQVRADGKKARKKTTMLNIAMEAGKSYYINVVAKDQHLVTEPLLMEVTINTAKRYLSTLKIDENCLD